MAKRSADRYLKVVDGKLPNRPPVSTVADATPPEDRTPSRVPRAPSHFTKSERQAWRDICKPICDRGLWGDKYRLWAESYAILVSVSRHKNRDQPDHKINRGQLRLYANDLRQILNVVQS